VTRERVRAAQAARPPKGARMLRGTVTVVSPLTVQIAGGGAVQGIPVPGAVYTVGGTVSVFVQEPGVGPVFPLPGTAAVPSTTGTLTYSGTAADWSTSRRSSLTKVGRLATLQLQATIGATPPVVGATIATIPAGFLPSSSNANFRAEVYANAWTNVTAGLEVQSDGRIFLVSTTAALAAGYGLFGLATYPTP
jgi:hypothetical protein